MREKVKRSVNNAQNVYHMEQSSNAWHLLKELRLTVPLPLEMAAQSPTGFTP